MANAQSVPGAGMETWRTGTSGSTSPKAIAAPAGWLGFDSLIIALGEGFGSFIGAGTNFHQQVFKESVIVHSGTHSAKLMTMKQDTLGLTPGSIGNYVTHVNTSALLSGGSIATATSVSGGLPLTDRLISASAWVQYQYGKTAGVVAEDTAILQIQAIKFIGGKDSVIGTGVAMIDSTSSWTQVTANIVYNDSTTVPDTFRITLTSSISGAVDSSALYVDDITLMSPLSTYYHVFTGVINYMVYPNPAQGVVNLFAATAGTFTFRMFDLTGREAVRKDFEGAQSIAVSTLPTGLYLYSITDASGAVQKTGKLSLMH